MISHLPLGFRPYTLPVCLCGEWPAPGRIQATHYDADHLTANIAHASAHEF